MTIQQAKILFSKYINNECSEEELKLLNDFLDSYQGTDFLSSTMDVKSINEFKKNSWKRIEPKIISSQNNRRRNQIRLYKKYVAAASVLLITSLAIFFNQENDNELIAPIIVSKNVEPGADKAVLTLGNGSQVVLGNGSVYESNNAESNGEKIVFKGSKQNTKDVSYNYLTIPRGGQFFVKLSDGTGVWLNSESQIKFPVNFIEGETRQVELVYGEAYFDVSPSSNHNGADFKVYHNKLEVQVLGTEFNIKAYKGETNVYATLVEGKVAVNIENEKQNLKPSQQLDLNTLTGVTAVKNVDIYSEVSWKEGVFSFESKSLKDVMNVLSRWYNINVTFKNKLVETEKFVGVLRKNQNLKEILTIIKSFEVIKNFEIKDNNVVIE